MNRGKSINSWKRIININWLRIKPFSAIKRIGQRLARNNFRFKKIYFSLVVITLLLITGLANSSLAALKVSTSDFNGDGKSDIVWRHSTIGDNAIWFMNGGTVSLATNIESDRNLNWKIVGTGDFDGNGTSDLLWREVTQGINRIWLMNGATVVSRPRILDALDLNWKVVGINDFNGDGKSDIVWRHSTIGDNAIWFMNGGTVSLATNIESDRNLNWKIVGT
ncbi:MAG TPA: VCBS repeat-containing protein, partial [Coleofasciculaceae cyanobacterium]